MIGNKKKLQINF